MFELEFKKLEDRISAQLSALEEKWIVEPWQPQRRGFKCGLINSDYYQLPENYYVFHNPADVKTWVPINGEPTSNTYGQVSVSM